MATLKEISTRLKSVKNIQKITKSMKMVSAAKYARAERELKPARPYGIAFYEKAEIGEPKVTEPHKLLIAVSSDRGLCGAIHSSIVKAIKAEREKSDVPSKIVIIGEKARVSLSRLFKKDILMSFNNVGKNAPTFQDASFISQSILESGFNFSSGELFYNKFKSVISYISSSVPVFALETIESSDRINIYDDCDAFTLSCFYEFSLASIVYYTLKEGATSEQSSRMTSMDNATKNAGEMISSLALQFNRTRQAVITRELIEIISGAAAV